jgi:phosphate transport system permease protein
MTATIEPTATLTVSDLRGDRRRLAKERIVRGLLLLAATMSIVISVLIIWSLVREAWNFISDVDLAALVDTGWFPRRGRFDVGTILIGTFVVSGIAMLVATPLGLGAAVYLSEYASARARRILKPIVEILAGVPSVVIGFFAVSFIGPDIVQPLFDTTQPKNMLVTGIAIGILVIPLVAAISEDALRAVPMSLREASFGVGARKSTTVVRIVLPAAISGIVAAFIVATSRAIGETMVAALASGRDGSGPFAWHPTDPGLTMTAAMAGVASGTDQVAGSGLAFQSLFFVGLVLFTMTLLLNIVADRFVARVRQKY